MDRQENSQMDQAPARRRRASGRVLALLFAAPLFIGSLSGCQILIGTLLTLQGRPMTTCDFTKMSHGRKLTEKGKKVIVVCSSTAEAQMEEPSLDFDVIAEVSRRLKVEKVKVVDDHKVASWLDDRGSITDESQLDPIGAQFGADYIILFKFTKFGYLEENSPAYFRGHASYRVVVVEMVDDELKPGKKRAKTIYNKPFASKFPTQQPISAEQYGSPDTFKSQYKRRLGQELARLFIDYRPEDDI